ncbi:MAG: ribokinase [Clostridia bacterium]|nr:ribokinase [Clostridia bacterium]
MSKIFVSGSFNIDITCYAPRIPRHGETVPGTSSNISSGGKGFNQATAAAHAGSEVVMLSKIGDDALSGIALGCYQKEGVSTRLLTVVKGVNTGCAFIEVEEETAENRIVIVSGANALVGKDDIKNAMDEIASCDYALTQLETSLESVEALAIACRALKKPLILNPAPAKPLPDDLFKLVSIFTPNETEAEFYTGVEIHTEEDADCAASILLQKGVQTAIITLGKKGVFYKTQTESGIIHAPKVKAVDTTGAGDAFNGALASRLASGEKLKDAMKFACAFASLSVTKKGAADSMPTREETDAFIKTL